MSSSVDKALSKTQEVINEDLKKAKAVALSAGKSGAYLYPIKGILYFLSHKDLWKPLAQKLIPTIGLSGAVVVLMFLFAYLPQLAVLVWVNGPLAAFTTALLTLSESSTIINIICRNFIISDALVDTFDGVLVSKNQSGIVAEGRELKSGNGSINKLGKMFKKPFEKFAPGAIIRYFLYLPLNFIPVVGTAIFIFVQGRSRGQLAHSRYFQLKKWSATQREAWLKENVGPYTAFGTIATLLELVPIASIFFSFTNATGAALWAADIEKNNTNMTETTAPNLREATKKIE